MSVQPVRVVGGPLDGDIHNLYFEPGGLIELNTAVGICIYQFGTSAIEEPILEYVGAGRLIDQQIKEERI